MITRIQKLYINISLVFVGLYYLLHFYPSMCLYLAGCAIILSLNNIYNCDMKKMGILLLIQLFVGFFSRMFFVYDCAIILVIANTLVCASFQDIYQHSSNKIRQSLGNCVDILILIFFVVLLLWTLLPLNIIAYDGTVTGHSVMDMLVLIVLVFAPIILEYISLKF